MIPATLCGKVIEAQPKNRVWTAEWQQDKEGNKQKQLKNGIFDKKKM